MPFPHTDREIYARNPLKEVICQLKFPAILEISGTEPIAFQNSIRDRYPVYARDEQTANVPPDVAQIIKQLPFGMRTPPVHKFTDSAGSTAIALGQDFLAITTSSYREWPIFKAEIDRAKAALEHHYRPTFYERIGLRYQDLIDRADLGLEGQPWSSLLKSFVLGFLGAPEIMAQVVGVNSLSVIAMSEVQGARAAIRHGHVERANAEDAYLFDVDFFIEERTTCDAVGTILDTFREVAGDLFRWVITDDLRATLSTPA